MLAQGDHSAPIEPACKSPVEPNSSDYPPAPSPSPTYIEAIDLKLNISSISTSMISSLDYALETTIISYSKLSKYLEHDSYFHLYYQWFHLSFLNYTKGSFSQDQKNQTTSIIKISIWNIAIKSSHFDLRLWFIYWRNLL